MGDAMNALQCIFGMSASIGTHERPTPMAGKSYTKHACHQFDQLNIAQPREPEDADAPFLQHTSQKGISFIYKPWCHKLTIKVQYEHVHAGKLIPDL
jgi:hypothetical protein